MKTTLSAELAGLDLDLKAREDLATHIDRLKAAATFGKWLAGIAAAVIAGLLVAALLWTAGELRALRLELVSLRGKVEHVEPALEGVQEIKIEIAKLAEQIKKGGDS